MTSHDIAHDHLAENARARTMTQVAKGHGKPDQHEREHALEWTELARIGFVAFAAAAVWFGIWEPIHDVSLIGVIGLLVGGWPILKEAFENILARRMTMELSMTIAIVAAAAIGELFTALVITLFVLIAEVLEGMTVSRGRRAIHDLLDFLPRSVSVRRADGVRDIDVDELQVGDAVLVNPGGRVPVDGTVLSGHSYLDQSRITGESMPVEKTAGSLVYAGSINQSGAIEIRVERVGRDTSFGKIIEAVERAEKSRAPVQRLADRLAGYLVYFALGAAALTFADIVGEASSKVVFTSRPSVGWIRSSSTKQGHLPSGDRKCRPSFLRTVYRRTRSSMRLLLRNCALSTRSGRPSSSMREPRAGLSASRRISIIRPAGASLPAVMERFCWSGTRLS
jgi:cation transport ATPase